MEYKARNHFRQVLCLLLSIVMLMSNLTAAADAVADALSAADSNSSAVQQSNTTQTGIVSTGYSQDVDNINFFVEGESVLVWGYQAYELAGKFNVDGTEVNAPFMDLPSLSDDARLSFVSADFTGYTAFVIEYLGIENSDGVEYYVDQVVDGSKKSDLPMNRLQAQTSNGFVLYIPTSRLTDNPLSHGDLIDTDFWHKNQSEWNTAASTIGHIAISENYATNPQAATPANVNATVKLFNYDETINAQGAGLVDTDNDGVADKYGFAFWAGFWGQGGEQETVDGEGAEDSGTAQKGIYDVPVMSDTLLNGYPALSDGTSLAYLFSGTSLRADNTSTQIATMTGGGGLFQLDENGYYYYDSLKNAAAYDSSSNKFILYKDLIVRPWYNANDGQDTRGYVGGSLESYGNFLPFNQINQSNITLDGAVYADGNPDIIQKSKTAPAGSLEYAGLTSDAAAKLLLGNKGLDDATAAQISGITTARLEEQVDMWFGMTVDFEFYMPKGGQVNGQDMTFDFHGDDDVFVYVGIWNESTGAYDYKLVLDIGGVHGARSGNINFADGTVTYDLNDGSDKITSLKEIFNLSDTTFSDYEKLSLKFFYVERGGNISYCRLKFNIPTLPDNSLTVSKELTGDGDYIEESGSCQFRVVQANDTNASFFKAGTAYNILENGSVVSRRTLGADGIFTLRANQSAQFEHILENRADDRVSQYIVQEIIPTDLTSQYSSVSYIIGSDGETSVDGTIDGDSTKYSTASLAGDQTQMVVFRNTVDTNKLGTLKITKALTENAKETLADYTFRIQVKLNGALLPVGTEYTVTDDTSIQTKTVDTAGVIVLMAGQTATIKGLLSGCEYEVSELGATTSIYTPSFAGTVDGGTVNCGNNSAEGSLPLAATASITVTNDLREGGIHVDKTVEATSKNDEFLLTLEALATGDTIYRPSDIVLVLDQSASMYTPVGWAEDRAYASKSQEINSALQSYAITDFVDRATSGDTELLNNAKRLGYYVAVHNQYNYIYIVQYAQNNAGQCGWYYVCVDQTVRSVQVDTENTTTDSGQAIKTYGTVVYGNAELLTNVTYYQSQSGALYDAVKSFVQKVADSGVDHRIAVVGFASSFYDGWDNYDGTGLYIDGNYYLYDTDYKYKNAAGQPLDPDVTYAGSVSKETLLNESEYRTPLTAAQYASALVSVRSDLDSVMRSVDAIRTNYQQTCPSAGMEVAQNIFKAYSSDNENDGRDKIVILFTDGVPTVKLASDRDYGINKAFDPEAYAEYWTISGGMEDAINKAHELKNNGIHIYAIGTSAMHDTSATYGGMSSADFLRYVSSDNPDATCSGAYAGNTSSVEADWWKLTPSLASPDASGAYTKFVSDDSSLNDVFEGIMNSITSIKIPLDETAVLREVLSKYFQLTNNAQIDVTVYTQAYNGADGSWGELVLFEDADVELLSSDGTARLDTIEVTGFDYSAHYVSTVARDGNYYGSKLVVKVAIKDRTGFWGGNNVPTNDAATGIYSTDTEAGETLVKKFPMPEVNIPVSPVLIALDKTIYYGGDVTADDLLDQISIDGVDVTIDYETGALTPAEDWMADFAELNWADTSANPTDTPSNIAPDDYTYQVKLTPKYDGESNSSENGSNMAGDPVSSAGSTASDTGHVYILVPQITFKDSVIVKGFTPTKDYYAGNNYVSTEWVHMDSNVPSDAPAVSGEEPSLTLTFSPVGTENGSNDYFQVDTQIDVKVTSSDPDGDISTVTTYLWQTCQESQHSNLLHGTITEHYASVADQHEFWIHVPDDGNTNSLILDKYVTATDDPNKFVLTLEAFATGYLESIPAEPKDIVLVLDQSASMFGPVGADYKYENDKVYDVPGCLSVEDLDVTKAAQMGYYIAQSYSGRPVGDITYYDWFIVQYINGEWYYVRVANTSTPVVLDKNTTLSNDMNIGGTFKRSEAISTFHYYKSQYGALYDTISSFISGINATGVAHRISLVGFASPNYENRENYNGTGIYIDGEYYLYEDFNNGTITNADDVYKSALTDVSTDSGYASISSSLDRVVTNYWHTCPAAGLKLAQRILTASRTADREQVVVLFTDGYPTVTSGGTFANKDENYADRDLYWSEYAGMNDAIAVAKTMKDSGIEIYTIGTNAVSDRKFLNGVSSDYPSATGWPLTETPTDDEVSATLGAPIAKEKYASFVKDEESLAKAFDSIITDTTSVTVSMNETAVLREVLSDYFDLDNGAVTDITVYTQAYNGATGNWGELVLFEDADVTLLSSDGTTRKDTIEVTGFDYRANYVSTGARDGFYGKKLVVKVAIETRPGFWGGNNVPTNEDTTGIYSQDSDSGETLVDLFPMPEVNVPVSPVVNAVDKTIYYGDDTATGELLNGITIGGVDVIINGDTLAPAEDWMDDFAGLSWTDTSSKPSDPADDTEPGDYTFQVQLTPKYDGESNRSENSSNMAGDPVSSAGSTASDTGHVYLLVPVVTFKDSTIEQGTKPDTSTYCPDNNYAGTQWVNMETNLPEGTVVPPVSGTEPDLGLTYTPENNIFLNDTKVNVTVNDLFTDVTTFEWLQCSEDLHDHVEQTNIEPHNAGNENTHEFWIHVPLEIVPDTVVIDFGLPVNIDVLANDPTIQNTRPILLGIMKLTDTAYSDSWTGQFGAASLSDSKVRYALNTSNGMQMNQEETFLYVVEYSVTDGDITETRIAYATVTVIPATVIYYEDNFVSYRTYTYTTNPDGTLGDATEVTDPDKSGWSSDPSGSSNEDKTQAEDRPGALTTADANNIYGYDGAYSTLTTHSLNSAMKFTAKAESGVNTYGTAEFTFYGTGFDVISVTSSDTGFIVVQVFDQNDTLVASTMVDTYYGYKYENDEWVVDEEASGALYQVPVIKIEGLNYGKYKAVITVSYNELLDHKDPSENGSYDFYLDAIRIYDPANDGEGNTTIQNAYVADGEGWPEYFELRNIVISKNTYDSLTTDSTPGVVFIDNTADNTTSTTDYVPSIADYRSYGPNNELYLAPGQAIAFYLNVRSDIDDDGESELAAIHLALKTVGNGTATVRIQDASDTTASTQTLSTSTDLYQPITSLNGKHVVIANESSNGAIVSITNIKVTYTEKHEDVDKVVPEDPTATAEYFLVSRETVRLALQALSHTANDQSPVTGDEFQPALYLFVMLGAVACLAVLLICRKKVIR